MDTKYTKWPQKYKMDTNIPNGHKKYKMDTKNIKWTQNIPNGHKKYKMDTKYTKWPYLEYTKWPQNGIPKFSIACPSKIYPNEDFRFENMYTIWQP
jgi:hypothetical protein